MLTMTPKEMLLVWGELVQAMYGKNDFGGKTAEFYAYRFVQRGLSYIPPSTARDNSPLSGYYIAEDVEAAKNLFELLDFFKHMFVVEIEFESISYEDGKAELLRDGFAARLQLTVINKK
jgi:hypothetical protein